MVKLLSFLSYERSLVLLWPELLSQNPFSGLFLHPIYRLLLFSAKVILYGMCILNLSFPGGLPLKLLLFSSSFYHVRYPKGKDVVNILKLRWGKGARVQGNA